MTSDNENSDKNHKLYSGHKHEQFVLRRHKTDLDQTNLKRLRELNSGEDLLLRRYQKYTQSGSAHSRRSSIDNSILRVSEVNQAANQSLSRNDDYAGISQKSPLRSTIRNERHYSLDTWNSMVDTEKNIIDSYKRSKLFGGNRQTDSGENKSSLAKKQTLKPINMHSPTIELTKDGFDDEIQMVQGGFRKRSNTSGSADLNTPMTDLRARRQSIDSNMATVRLPSIKVYLKHSPKIRKKKFSSSTSSSLESLDDYMKLDRDMCKSRSPDSYKSILRKPSPRPVANASVFIHEDTEMTTAARRNRRSSFDVSALMEDENTYLENLRRKTRSPSVSFLPIIPQSPLQVNRGDQTPIPSIIFDQDTLLMNGSAGSQAIRKESSPRVTRRPSLSTTTLKLMVDTHHGAAKLRYIARLAIEMEKEETAKLQTPEERPIREETVKETELTDEMIEELRKCRYLRLNEKRGSSETDGNDGVFSL